LFRLLTLNKLKQRFANDSLQFLHGREVFLPSALAGARLEGGELRLCRGVGFDVFGLSMDGFCGQ
jgi:hypothetical protein